MKSLRRQLFFWSGGLFTVSSILAGLGAGYMTLERENSLLDDQLRQVALSVSDRPSAAGESAHILAGADPDDRIVVHITDRTGATIRNSDPLVEIPVQKQTGFSTSLWHGVEWRSFTLIVEARVIQISQETTLRTAAAIAAMRNTVLPIILLIPLSWLFFGIILTRQLRPLDKLTASLLAPHSNQNFTLATSDVPQEVLPLVLAMNDLLGRQHELLELRQRFISDAAHQLRSPVTALKLQMLNLKEEIGALAELEQLRQLEAGLTRMGLLLEQLLRLARAEAPGPAFTEPRAEIGDVVRQAIIAAYPLAQSHQVDLGLVSEVSAIVMGDHLDLVMMISNLLENAIVYGQPAQVRQREEGNHVDVSITMFDHEVVVEVIDQGSGLPEAVLDRVFERFYRHAARDTMGSGLGLSIVAALAARSGALVSLENRRVGDEVTGLIARVKLRRIV